MYKTENLEKLAKYALLSAYIADVPPVSVLFCGDPESAKTSMILDVKSKDAIVTSDLSPKALIEGVLPLADKEGKNFLIVPDWIKVMQHKEDTSSATITMCNSIMEEGLQQQDFYGQQCKFSRPIRMGVITSCTPAIFLKFAKKWYEIGFLTRFLTATYGNSDQTSKEIHALIREGRIHETHHPVNVTDGIKRKFCNPLKQVDIKLDGEAAYKVQFIMEDVRNRLNNYQWKMKVQGNKMRTFQVKIEGYRLHRQLQTLAKAIALSNNRTKVTLADIEELSAIADLIRFPNDPKMI